VSNAVAALIGVALGAFLTGGTQLVVTLLLERRRLVARQKVAARLLVEELEWLHVKAQSLTDHPRAVLEKDVQLYEDLEHLWREHRATFASALSWSEWNIVVMPLGEARHLLGPGELSTADRVAPLVQTVGAAIDALKRHAE
jgi:hypothetical protein